MHSERIRQSIGEPLSWLEFYTFHTFILAPTSRTVRSNPVYKLKECSCFFPTGEKKQEVTENRKMRCSTLLRGKLVGSEAEQTKLTHQLSLGGGFQTVLRVKSSSLLRDLLFHCFPNEAATKRRDMVG